jgi:hypothetical protein
VVRGSLFCGCNAVIEAEMRRILAMMLCNCDPDWSRTQNPMLERTPNFAGEGQTTNHGVRDYAVSFAVCTGS